MDTFGIILITGMVITILLFILMLIFLIQFIFAKKSLKKLEKGRLKSRKKKKYWSRDIKALSVRKTKKIKYFIFCLIGFLSIGSGTAYIKYYQSTNISGQDIDNIVYSYYLLEQIEEQINKIDETNEKKSANNIHTLAISLSSFASKKGSDKSVVEAQILLNKYYAVIGQFGVNLSSQNFQELKSNKDKQNEFLDDILVVKKLQQEVIKYYKIDESSLKAKK
ncbi:hypothetical protein JZO82_10315 [Vagococcus fluvialis]|uniref:hypothetical protein n=1 Tax=Vagococcus fluvialis TaxID=2738 RepID=UPI001A8C3F08|nr:hypothetical protein [Vagococcus fluvialis]MBO0429555.1 hypothetical protein [Vagococcus fluvialis]